MTPAAHKAIALLGGDAHDAYHGAAGCRISPNHSSTPHRAQLWGCCLLSPGTRHCNTVGFPLCSSSHGSREEAVIHFFSCSQVSRRGTSCTVTFPSPSSVAQANGASRKRCAETRGLQQVSDVWVQADPIAGLPPPGRHLPENPQPWDKQE